MKFPFVLKLSAANFVLCRGLLVAACCLTGMSTQAQSANPSKAATASGVKTDKPFRDCATCPEMLVIPAGSFDMGSPDSEDGRTDDEGPLHRVNLASFAMSRTEITTSQFAVFVHATGYDTGELCSTLEVGKVEVRNVTWSNLRSSPYTRYAVGCVNWNDATAYTKWLSAETGRKYRLPTEAEWEYAARGNTRTARYWGDDPDVACKYANTADQTAQAKIKGASSWTVHQCTDGYIYTAPDGSFKANAFGLKDMLGNAWEWTEDGYHDSYLGAPIDGTAWRGDGAKHVLRGGSWNSAPRDARAAVRNSYDPGLRYTFFGFRVVREVE